MSHYCGNIGVFFDVDGTLADSYRLGFDSTNEVLKNHNIQPIDEHNYHEGTKYTTPRRLAWHVTGNPDDPIGESLGQEFDELYINLVTPITAGLYPGIKEMFQKLRKQDHLIQFAALSNAHTDYVRAVLRVNDLESYFEIGLGAEAVPAAKPAPDGLWQICRHLQLPPVHCIYIGDSPTDGQAATNAGMKSIGVTWGSHSLQKVAAGFPIVVHTVNELENQLFQFIEEQRQLIVTNDEKTVTEKV
jgi:HAD superfamily hydrolase (TIGR01509 family)